MDFLGRSFQVQTEVTVIIALLLSVRFLHKDYPSTIRPDKNTRRAEIVFGCCNG